MKCPKKSTKIVCKVTLTELDIIKHIKLFINLVQSVYLMGRSQELNIVLKIDPSTYNICT